MTTNGIGYDRALLDEAPEATPGDRKRFYDADLLLEPAQQRSANATPAPILPTAARSQTDLEAGHGKEFSPSPTSVRATPWYKTRKGIIGILIVAIVIIGAVVGGAVGGTVGKSNNNKSSVNSSQAPIAGPSGTSSTSSASASSASAGIGTGGGGGAPIGGASSTSSATTGVENQPIATASETTSGGGVAPIGTALAIANTAVDV